MIIYVENNELRNVFSNAIKFDEVALRSREKEYSRIEATEKHLKLIRGISKIICEFLNIPELPMKGTSSRALKEWQLKSKLSITEIPKMPTGRALNAVKEIFSIGKRMVKEMVSESKEKSDLIIDIAFEKAFWFFLEHFSRNRF
ncbi:MAG: hypothetical protein ACXABO_02290 [Promethearchaeota archaeon]